MNDSAAAAYATAELRQLAHDVRNALNGVAVNLEVARSRTARDGDAAAVTSFIDTAVEQLDVATRLHRRYTEMVAAMAAESAARRDVHTRDVHTTD